MIGKFHSGAKPRVKNKNRPIRTRMPRPIGSFSAIIPGKKYLGPVFKYERPKAVIGMARPSRPALIVSANPQIYARGTT